jgi:hypothetical protein
LIKFATEDYDTAKIHGRIPVEPTLFEKLWKIIVMGIEDSGGMVNMLMMKDD